MTSILAAVALAVTSPGPAGSIHGVVRDAARRAPLAGVAIELRLASAKGSEGNVRASTDAQGRYRVPLPAPGLYEIVVRATGYAPSTRSRVPRGSAADFFLSPAPTFQGLVRGANRAVVTGARILVEAAPGAAAPAEAFITDQGGRFLAGGPASGKAWIHVRHAAHAPWLVRVEMPRQPQGVVPMKVALELGVLLRGRLIGDRGRPLNGRVSPVQIDAFDLSRQGAAFHSVEADAEGRFALRVPTGARVTVLFEAPGYLPKQIQVKAPRLKPLDLGDIALEGGATIAGTVQDIEGTPVRDAQVMAVPLVGSTDAVATGAAGADGSFALRGLPPGRFRLVAEAPGYQKGSLDAETGVSDLAIVLRPHGAIAGKVVDEDGRPVEAYEVAALASFLLRPAQTALVAAADGGFLLSGLPEATYDVEVAAPGQSVARVREIAVVEGRTTVLDTIRLRSGTTLRGRVVDSRGNGVAGAMLSAVGYDRASLGRPETRSAASTGVDGQFALSGLAPGRVDLLVTHTEYASRRASVNIDPRDEEQPVLTLTSGGRVAGAVRGRGGAPVSGRIVHVSTVEPAGDGSTDLRATSRADGTYVVEHVPAGRVAVEVLTTEASEGARSRGGRMEAVVREGEQTRLDLEVVDIAVTGRVTRRGLPASGYSVQARGVGGDAAGAASPAGADGSFALTLPAPGTYVFQVTTPLTRQPLPARTVEILDAPHQEVELLFGETTVNGVVLEADSLLPVAGASVSAVREDAIAGARAVTADRDGRFAVPVDGGAHVVTARAEGRASVSQRVTVTEDAATEVELRLGPGGAIEGRVVDGHGRGVPGVRLSAVPPQAAALGDRTVTGPDGEFHLHRLAAEPHVLFGRTVDGRFALRADVEPGVGDVQLRLEPGAPVTLRLKDAEGHPIRSAAVALTSVSGVRLSGMNIVGASDADGVAALALPLGELTLRISRPGLEGTASVVVRAGTGVIAIDVPVL